MDGYHHQEAVWTSQFCSTVGRQACIQHWLKEEKAQQVGFNNPQDYIIPESGVNALTSEVQKSYNTAQNCASKTFANYYGGTGDTRAFVWTAKPPPPAATSLDRLGADYDRNRGNMIRNLRRAYNLAEGLEGQKMEYIKT